MTKAKTNALDALRSLIAERQQYEQWISALESRREGTPEHVFERVRGDYQSRLERVVQDIRGHAEELQLSISTLSSRLVEVARDEDTRREGLQEAELRAAVGEYEPEQWEQLRTDAEKELAKIAADRASLDSQLGELRAIQKLSEATGGTPAESPAPAVQAAPAPAAASQRQEATAPPLPEQPAAAPTPAPTPSPSREPAAREAQPAGHRAGTSASAVGDKPASQQPVAAPPAADAPVARQPEQERSGPDPVAAAASAAASAAARSRATKTPPGGVSAAKGRPEQPRPDSAKTLKCPECGTANYPTEWYCERCGGELATM